MTDDAGGSDDADTDDSAMRMRRVRSRRRTTGPREHVESSPHWGPFWDASYLGVSFGDLQTIPQKFRALRMSCV